MSNRTKISEIEFPVLALRDTVVFPRLVTPLLVGREQSKESIRHSTHDNSPIVLLAQRNASEEEPATKDLYRVGVACNLLQVVNLPDGSLKVLVEALSRVKVRRFVWRGSCRKAHVIELPDAGHDEPAHARRSIHEEASARTVVERFERYALLNPVVPKGVTAALQDMKDSGQIADTVAAHVTVSISVKQRLLEMLSPGRRLEAIAEILQKEIDILEYQKSIDAKVRDRIQKTQRDYFLREQIRVLREELDGESDQSIAALEKRIKDAKMPAYAETAATRELDRLSQSQLHSPQAAVSIDYIETLLAMPWNTKTEDDLDVAKAKLVLDRDHYGLDEVKDRVLDYLAVRKLTSGQKGQILCFIGPPGVGKTSIARSIAAAMGRKFFKKSLGGVRDEAEIRGHRRTYVAAMPGGIIKGISKAGSRNPVFLLDEIDKLSRDFHGDPGAALLEVLDPVDNKSFTDHYLEMEFDLSDVFFIATGNWLENIPPVLRDRMEVIRFSGYTPNEKIEIAIGHLIPELLKEHGLKEDDLAVSRLAINQVILSYTREAGVRELKRRLAGVCRKVARKCAQGETGKLEVQPGDLQAYLGPPPYFGDMLAEPSTGTATGLAWTETGGSVMSIEVSFVPGKGRLSLTGSLGNVMKESAKAALTFVKSNAGDLKLDCSNMADVHIHVPEGGTPKDGPSAGLALIAALVSAYKGRTIDPTIAFTGEITLRGRVLPVGGIKEKLLAAHREGVHKVIMPDRNRPDLQRVPKEILDALSIEFVTSVQQAIGMCGLRG
ncbi:MAG TPA: endopeptidase La [Planctomycetota bacterium]|nr:endopeptidase La [Planctomycetota bacterium]